MPGLGRVTAFLTLGQLRMFAPLPIRCWLKMNRPEYAARMETAEIGKFHPATLAG